MKKLLTLALALFVAFSATPSEPVHPSVFWKKKPKVAATPVAGEIVMYHTIENDLEGFIDERCKLITTDSMFGCISEEKVQAMVKNLLFTFDNTYIDEARDCDDLGLEFLVKFRRFFREVTGGVPLAAPCALIGVKLVGDIPEMGYLLGDKVGYHAIVIIRCQGGKYLLVDPGTKRVSEFTQHLYEGTMELRLVIF